MCDVHTKSRPEGGDNSPNRAICNYTDKRYPSRVNGEYMRKKYDLLEIAAGILKRDPDIDWRTVGCMSKMLSSNVNIYQSNTDNGRRGHFGGLMTCGLIWVCPVCAAKIAAKRKEEIKLIIQRSQCTPLFITWTHQHHLKDFLKDVLGSLKKGLLYTRSGATRDRLYKKLSIEGYIRSIEIRWGFKFGWHPHAHEILLINLPPHEIDIEEVKKILSERYYKWLRKNGYYVNEAHTIDVRLCYPSGDETIAEAAAKYMTKSSLHLEMTEGQEKENQNAKSFSPFQLLDMYQSTGELFYSDLFLEYVKATKGRRQLTFSRGLKKKYLIEEKDDKELVDEQIEEATLICSVDRENWLKLLNKRLRGEVLIEASLRPHMLVEWLAERDIIANYPVTCESYDDLGIFEEFLQPTPS